MFIHFWSVSSILLLSVNCRVFRIFSKKDQLSNAYWTHVDPDPQCCGKFISNLLSVLSPWYQAEMFLAFSLPFIITVSNESCPLHSISLLLFVKIHHCLFLTKCTTIFIPVLLCFFPKLLNYHGLEILINWHFIPNEAFALFFPVIRNVCQSQIVLILHTDITKHAY